MGGGIKMKFHLKFTFFSFLGKSPCRSWNVLGILQILMNKTQFFVNLTISFNCKKYKRNAKKCRREGTAGKARHGTAGKARQGRHGREGKARQGRHGTTGKGR
jgi:hypothetical protein